MSKRTENTQRGTLGTRARRRQRLFLPAALLAAGMMIIGCPQMPVDDPQQPELPGQPTRGLRDLGDILADFVDDRGVPEDLGVGLTIESDRVVTIVSEAISGDNPDQELRDSLTGPAGTNGTNGEDGSEGRDGLPGSDGRNGADGVKGDKGNKGEMGDRGQTGTAGATGAQGEMGEQGPPGPAGDPTQIPPGTLPGSVLITESVTGNKLAPDAFTGGPTSFQGEIDGSLLVDRTVDGAKLASNSVTGEHLADTINIGSIGPDAPGELRLFNRTGRQTIVLDGDDGNAGELSIRNAGDTTTVLIKGHSTGGPAAGSGELVVRNMNGVDSAIMRAVETGGQIDLLNQMGRIGAVLESNDGNLSGQLRLFADADPNATFVARAVGPFGAGFLELRDPGSGDTRVQLTGGDGPLSNFSQLVLFGPTTNDRRVTLESGAPPNSGATLGLWNGGGQPTATLDGGFADGGATLTLRNGDSGGGNPATIVLDGGADQGGGEVEIKNGNGQRTLWLRGHKTGDPAAGSGELRMYDRQQTEVARLWVPPSESGGRLDLNRADGSTGIVLESSGGGGAVLHMRSTTASTNTITLFAGGDGPDGGGLMWLNNGRENSPQGNRLTIRLDANSTTNSGEITLATPDATTVLIQASDGDGGARLAMRNGDASAGNPETITLDANESGMGATLRLWDGPNNEAVNILADNGGGGFIGLHSEAAGAATVRLLGATGEIELLNGQGPPQKTIVLDGSGATASGGAKLTLRNLNPPNNHDTIVLDAGDAGSNSGEITLANASGFEGVRIGARGPTGVGFGGDVRLFHQNANAPESPTVALSASTNGGLLTLFKNDNSVAIQLDGSTGNVAANGFICRGTGEQLCADIAETFDLRDRDAVRPGMVLVIDPQQAGQLTLSTERYDKRVAGIVSGAGNLQPGMQLGGRTDGSNDLPIALSGRVYCYVDASEHAVEVGDLLTTSDTPGYAMKAVDHERAFGAVLGKAMQPLAKGEKGLVLVLVALQ